MARADRPTTPILLLFALLASAGLGGCAWTKAPSARVVDARVTSETQEGAVLSFVIEASNRNDKELPLGRAKYSVWVDGKKVFSGTRDAQAGIRRHGSQRFELPTPILAADLPSAPATVRISGRVTYAEFEQIARVLHDIGVRNPKVSFRDERTIDLSPVEPELAEPGEGVQPEEDVQAEETPDTETQEPGL